MTKTRRFVDSFWETDFTGTLGFDHLCKRIKDGQRVCKEIEDFFKRRAKAEQHYSKDLYSLVKAAESREEAGVLGKSWQELKVQTERIASSHENAAIEYNRLADELSKFTDEIKAQTKQMEDKVKDSHKVKKNLHSKATDLQRVYGCKCREMKQQDDQYRVVNEVVTTTPKELEKVKAKADKSKEAMEQSDAAYKQALEVLEKARCAWESDTEDTCIFFQSTDEDRISVLRNAVWKCTNIGSQVCVTCDEGLEAVRCCLENCDVAADIQDFIEMYMTGSVRPAPIVYENYFKMLEKPRRRDASVSPRLPRKPAITNQPLPLPPKVIKDEALYSQPYSHKPAYIDSAKPYSYANGGKPPPIAVKYKVTKNYHDSLNGLMLHQGDIVQQLEREDSRGMVTVQIDASSKVGVMPKNCIQIL